METNCLEARSLCPATAKMEWAEGRREHCWAGGAGHECLCRPYREQELNFQGHWVALQDFKQKSHLFMFFRNILLAVVIIDLAGG